MRRKNLKKELVPLIHIIKALPLHESDILTLLTHTKTLPKPGLRYLTTDLSNMISTDLYNTLRENTFALIRNRPQNSKINFKEIIKLNYPTFNDALNEIPLLIQIFGYLQLNNPILNHLKILKGNICEDGFYFYAQIFTKKIKFKFPFFIKEKEILNYFNEQNENSKRKELLIRNLSKESIFTDKFHFKKLKIKNEENDKNILKEFVKGRRILKNVLNLYKELINEIINVIKKKENCVNFSGVFNDKSFKIESVYKDVYSMIILSNGGSVCDKNYEYVIKDSFIKMSDDICLHPQFLFDCINDDEFKDPTKYMSNNLPKQKCVFKNGYDEFTFSKNEKFIIEEENYF
ncbi:hypothetical protein TUBRATIS_19350, partial [Tubulinosema ratisbonensis]